MGKFRESAFICALIGKPRVTTIEEWSNNNSNKTTPDELISAAIIRNIAKNFDEWRPVLFWTSSSKLSPKAFRNSETKAKTSLYCKKKACNVVFSWSKKDVGDYYSPKWVYDLDSVCVNDVEIDLKQGRLILSAWEKVKTEVEASIAAAAEAKRLMEENEKKWNIAEHLLGMVRDPKGALVPKTKVEDETTHSCQSFS